MVTVSERMFTGQALENIEHNSKTFKQIRHAEPFEDMHRYNQGYACPTTKAVQAILSYSSHILEVAAGSGHWGYELQEAGADIICTDKYGNDNPDNWWNNIHTRWCDVEQLDAVKAVQKYPDRDLLIVYPPLSDIHDAFPFAHQHSRWQTKMLEAFTGRYIFYVGEWEGCTGTDSFHHRLDRDYNLVESFRLPTLLKWVYDTLYVLERKA